MGFTFADTISEPKLNTMHIKIAFITSRIPVLPAIADYRRDWGLPNTRSKLDSMLRRALSSCQHLSQGLADGRLRAVQ